MANPISTFFKKKTTLLVGLLAVLTFLAFVPVLKAQFLTGQDGTYLTANANVLGFDWAHFKALLKSPVEEMYIPLSNLSFFIEHKLFGLNPFVFHLNSLLLHVLAVGLVFFFARNLGLDDKEAFLGAFIFALHPSKVEAVAWVSQRKELLCAVFYLGTLISYQKNKFWIAFGLGVLSMLANPIAASLVFVLLLMEWFNGKTLSREAVLRVWPFLALSALVIWINFTPYWVMSSSVLTAVLIWVWSFVFYIAKFFIPVVFLPFYVLPQPEGALTLPYIIAFLGFAAVIAGLWFGRKNELFVFAFGFYILCALFFLPLAPNPKGAVVADHFLYLSSLGFCLLAAVGVLRLKDILKSQEEIIRHLYTLAVGLLMLGLLIFTFNQSLIWKDSATLWKYQLKATPHPVVYNNLALALAKSEGVDDKEVAELYRQAIAKDGRYIPSYLNLARMYTEKKAYPQALALYEQAKAIDPKSKEVMFGLGTLYQAMNQPEKAVETFKALVKIDPEDEAVYVWVVDAYSKALAANPQEKIYQERREEVLSEAEDLSKRKKYSAGDYFNLGFLYEQVGGYEEAVRFYKKALEITPTHEKALYALANRYKEAGELKAALVLYQHLVHFHPKNTLGYLNMGIIYNGLGDVDHARMYYQKTISIDPNNAGAYFNLGYLYESSGDMKEALNNYEKAIESNPQLSEAYYNMGNVYAALGQIPEAIASYLKTVSVNKNHQNAYVNLSILSFKSRDFAGASRYLEEARLLGYTPPAEYLKSLEPYKKR